ncbi:hypothetical protein ACNS7O_18150 (plasmid) [Haloferacaceae archaeon DSL9]
MTGRVHKLFGAPESAQSEAIRSGSTRVAVYGLGPTGASLSVIAASVTRNVVAIDDNDSRVHAVNHGRSPVKTDPHLDSLVERAVSSSALRATTTSNDRAQSADVHVIAAPTGLRSDDTPDLSSVRTATRDVGAGLEAGDLVIVASAVPPRTCRDLVAPMLCDESGLDPGSFGLAACSLPRDRTIRGIRTGAAVVGGLDPQSAAAARTLFEEFTTKQVVETTDLTVVECATLLEHAAATAMAAMTNELALLADQLGADVAETVQVVNERGDIDLTAPGLPSVANGVGLLLDRLVADAPMLRTLYREANAFPGHLASLVAAELDAVGIDPRGAKVLLLGLDADVDPIDPRGSPVCMLTRELTTHGVEIDGIDPDVDIPPAFVNTVYDVEEFQHLDPDAVLILTDRERFDRMDVEAVEAPVFLDCRGSLETRRLDAVRPFGACLSD